MYSNKQCIVLDCVLLSCTGYGNRS